MERIEIFQIDAFTDKVFYGNPAAVCLLDEWLNDELMQAIAVENNLSETAFVMHDGRGYHIRWFTPNGEIDLCGHATLAAGFALIETKTIEEGRLEFNSKSGTLGVFKSNGLFSLDFPIVKGYPCRHPETVVELINKEAVAVMESEMDYLIELSSVDELQQVDVDLTALAELDIRGLIITAAGDDIDFHSRCFYPRHHIPEDPVTGSAHCLLSSYWSEKLNKTSLTARQGSVRQGTVFCEVRENNRVYLSGACRWYSKGELLI